jgi:hypothetical protein
MTPMPPEPEEPIGSPPALDPPAVACINQTRAAVLNIIIVAGLLLVVSGFVVREFDFGVPRMPQDQARRVAYGTLFVLVVASYGTRRALSSRQSLRDPRTRGPRFYLAHVVGALIGALAVPLGFLYGVAVRPELREIAPFWVAGMALGFLALPRGHELADFDEPMTALTRRMKDEKARRPRR